MSDDEIARLRAEVARLRELVTTIETMVWGAKFTDAASRDQAQAAIDEALGRQRRDGAG